YRGLRGVGQLLGLEKLEQHRLGRGQKRGKGGHHRPSQAAALQQCCDLVEQQLEVERDHQLGLAVAQLEGELLKRVERVIVYDRRAELQGGVEVDDEGRAIRHQQTDLAALANAEPLQPGGSAIDRAADLGVAQRLAEEVRAWACAVAGDSLIEQLKQGHR